jgi:hypothetical protein
VLSSTVQPVPNPLKLGVIAQAFFGKIGGQKSPLFRGDDCPSLRSPQK